MKRTKYFLLFLLPGLLHSSLTFSQKLVETLKKYNNSFVEEKMHVHFDKPVYNSGETIWFKAYLLNSNTSLSQSTNLYTELLTEEGNVIERKVYPIFESSTAGSFDIPQQARNSHLFFRAYTTWMLNFDTSFLYTKQIPVVQPSSPSTATQPKETVLRFFPEGGNWVTGLPAILAFKATDNNGLPKAVSGVIKNTAGQTITAFKSIHNGMGKVELEALPEDVYYAEWKDENNQLHKTVLPAQETTGVALQLTPTNSHIGFTVRRRNDNTIKRAHVLAQMYNQVVYQATINFSSSEVSGAIPARQLASGILQLTVFDTDWQPLAERIVFINNGDYLFASSINLLTKNLNKRGKNTIEIEIPDSLKTNLSLSVTDAGLKTDNGEESIISRLLLTSDLRGYIHQPEYYFSSTTDSVQEHLDLVMLTHGWRRYNWQQLAKGELPAIKFPRENYLNLQGHLTGAATGQLPDNTQLNLILQTKDSSRQFLTLPVNKSGHFAADGLIFFDTAKLYYQFNKNARLDRKAKVDFTTHTYRTVVLPGNGLPPFFTPLPHAERNQFFAIKRKEVLPLYDKKVKTLEGVVVKAKIRSREEELEKRYTSGLFQTGRSRNFNLLDDPSAIGSMNVLNYLQGKVAGLQISYGGGSNYRVERRGSTPAFYIDEMQADPEQLAMLVMSDIAFIKVIDPPFMGAPGNGAGGAIAVYTRRGDDAARSTTKGLEQGTVIGYSMPREFYSPDYATFSPLHEIEDIRSTLHWAPYILTDKTNKKIKIEFYNNDVSQSLRIVLEGLNEIGQVTRMEKVIQ